MLDDRVRAVLARLEEEDSAEQEAGVSPAQRSLAVGPESGRLLFALVASISSWCLAQDAVVASALEKAEVRIPYLELRKLWESANAAAKPPEPETPPPGALLSTQFKADLSDGKYRFKIEVSVFERIIHEVEQLLRRATDARKKRHVLRPEHGSRRSPP